MPATWPLAGRRASRCVVPRSSRVVQRSKREAANRVLRRRTGSRRAETGDAERAGQLWGAVDLLERELGWSILDFERDRYPAAARRCEESNPLLFHAAAERGRRMVLDEIVD
jgi:hypothetical protein